MALAFAVFALTVPAAAAGKFHHSARAPMMDTTVASTACEDISQPWQKNLEGYTCKEFTEDPSECLYGDDDDTDFSASTYCCACFGGTTPCADTPEWSQKCKSYPYASSCGNYDDSDFSSSLHCCICGGGTLGAVYPPERCNDSAPAEAKNDANEGCSFYESPGYCDDYDDDDFTGSSYCCMCGGGLWARHTTTTTTTLETYVLEWAAHEDGLFNQSGEIQYTGNRSLEFYIGNFRRDGSCIGPSDAPDGPVKHKSEYCLNWHSLSTLVVRRSDTNEAVGAVNCCNAQARLTKVSGSGTIKHLTYEGM